MTDQYRDDRPAGSVIGSRSPAGELRRGVDAESILSIDHEALRIGCPTRPGWKRHGIVYGPYERTAGLAFAVFMVNGHNGSQTVVIPRRSISGHLQAILCTARRSLRRRLSRILPVRAPATPNHYHWPPIRDNLAVGWFSDELPSKPSQQGNALVMVANGPTNGDLHARVHGRAVQVIPGVPNIQFYYVVVLREEGAAYYAAAAPANRATAVYPEMRPLAIDATCSSEKVYAGIHQSILSETRFRIDTRVYGSQVTEIPELATWYGTAHIADALVGSGPLEAANPEQGHDWRSFEGAFERTPVGARARESRALALVGGDSAPGLIHVLIEPRSDWTEAGLVWRARDSENFWAVLLQENQARLLLVEAGAQREIAVAKPALPAGTRVHALQVADDGTTFTVNLDGHLLFGGAISDPTFGEERQVGLASEHANDELYFRRLEAHPRAVPIPEDLRLGTPWSAHGTRTVVSDSFDGPARDLAGSVTTTGDREWRRDLGTGVIEVTGNGSAKVRASPDKPNPGRTVYTIPWGEPEFAEIEAEILPPGTARGQNQLTRAGLVFWQDEHNYFILNCWNDDQYPGCALSTFFTVGGDDDLFNAVWCNVGTRIKRGEPLVLRLTFDGNHYAVYLDGVLFLYRALTDVFPSLTRLEINRVGIAANWEWGDDTGSEFRNFKARGAGG